MSQPIEFSCRCREVGGRLENASPRTLSRMTCYCDDCQAFLHHLGRAELLDPHGGTNVVQVAPSAVRFERGTEKIRAVRLTPKGLYRWYAGCCNTPLGNTLAPSIPFVGMNTAVFQTGSGNADSVLGKTIGAVRGEYAIGGAPQGSTGMNLQLLRLIGRSMRKMLGWRLGGKSWPHPFFERATRAPKYPVTQLSADQRAALHPLCGPHPAPRSA